MTTEFQRQITEAIRTAVERFDQAQRAEIQKLHKEGSQPLAIAQRLEVPIGLVKNVLGLPN